MSHFQIHEALDRPALLRAMEQAFQNAKLATHAAADLFEPQSVGLDLRLSNSIREHASAAVHRLDEAAGERLAVEYLTFMAIVDAGFHPVARPAGGFAASWPSKAKPAHREAGARPQGPTPL